MKYIVFLLMLCCCIKPLPMDAKRTGYTFDYFELYVEPYSTNQGTGFILEKTGDNAFQTLFFNQYEHCTVTTVDIINDYIIAYGYTHIEGDDTYYDGFFSVFTISGDFLIDVSIDYDDLEEVEGIYQIRDYYIVHVRQSTDYGYEFDVTGNYYQLYDSEFTYINDQFLEENYHHSIGEYYLLLDKENDGFMEYGLTDSLTLIQADDPLVITELVGEFPTVRLDFINEAIVNNEQRSNGIVVDFPGQYNVLYNNEAYFFTIEASITGVEDNAVYTEALTPTTYKGTTYLNNDLYVSGTEISTPGYYDMVVTGLGNYQKSISFTITSNLVGVENEQHYTSPLTFTFNGDGYLNETYITSPYTVSEAGQYTLKILGENNYIDIVTFEIDETEEDISLLSIVQKVDVYAFIIVVITGVIILKKK